MVPLKQKTAVDEENKKNLKIIEKMLEKVASSEILTRLRKEKVGRFQVKHLNETEHTQRQVTRLRVVDLYSPSARPCRVFGATEAAGDDIRRRSHPILHKGEDDDEEFCDRLDDEELNSCNCRSSPPCFLITGKKHANHLNNKNLKSVFPEVHTYITTIL